MTVLESAYHGSFVDDFASGSVDNDGAFLQLPDHLLADESFCLFPERNVHAQHICDAEHLVQSVGAEVLAPFGSDRRGLAVVVDDAHRECAHEFSEAQSNASQSKDSDCTTCRVVRVSRLEL